MTDDDNAPLSKVIADLRSIRAEWASDELWRDADDIAAAGAASHLSDDDDIRGSVTRVQSRDEHIAVLRELFATLRGKS